MNCNKFGANTTLPDIIIHTLHSIPRPEHFGRNVTVFASEMCTFWHYKPS